MLVAWVCILWSPYTRSELPPEQEDRRVPNTHPGPDGVYGWWWTGQGFGVSDAVPIGAAVTEGEEHLRYWRGRHTPAFYRAGWPALSRQSVVTSNQNVAGGKLAGWSLPYQEILRRGLQTSLLPAWLHAREERRLPIVPLWSGFVVNTSLYFGVLFAFSFLWRKDPKKNVQQSLHRSVRPRFDFGGIGCIERWIRRHRPFPAAVGDGGGQKHGVARC